jgi:glycosyltransferase involved in cell wall biosynthesis
MLRTLAHGLTNAGVETHIATTDDDGAGRVRIGTGFPTYQDGIPYWYFPRQVKFYTVSLPMAKWLARRCSDYDVVHIHALFSHASVAAARAARQNRIPYIVRPLGTLNRWGMENRRPWLKAISMLCLESRILKNAAFVHFTSEQEREEAAELGITYKSAIIPNALPTDDSQPAISGAFRAKHPEVRDRTLLLFLSRIDRKKGLDLLLPAFARVCKQYPNTALVIAGGGETTLITDLKKLASSLGIANSILWVGFLDDESKRSALADTDVFVLPSYSENFGIAALEAMNAGLPVVVSNQTALHREVAAAQAGITVRCQIEDVENAIIRLVQNADEGRRMGANGRELVNTKFSLGAVIRRTVQIYDQALSQ